VTSIESTESIRDDVISITDRHVQQSVISTGETSVSSILPSLDSSGEVEGTQGVEVGDHPVKTLPYSVIQTTEQPSKTEKKKDTG
jgi:hypothetical protein